jgi:thiazole/oxazole-forming peptide maturase SagC family component
LLSDFDVIKLPDGGYELISGHSIFKVGFNDATEQAMFDTLVEYRTKSNKDTVRRLLKLHSKESVLSFFSKLKAAGLVLYDNDDDLKVGKTYERSVAQRHELENVAKKSIAIISTSNISIILKQFDIFANSVIFDAKKLINDSKLEDIIAKSDFFVVDACSYNPLLVETINAFAIALNKPWLLIQAIYDRDGHIGPIFYGKDTGCYHCFRQRLRSNVNGLDSFDRYAQWLDDNNKFSQLALQPSNSFYTYIASIAAIEVEKFLVGREIPQSYGYLLSADPRNYNVEQHRLFKVPFCEVCNDNFEYRKAPWLDAITLKVL